MDLAARLSKPNSSATISRLSSHIPIVSHSLLPNYACFRYVSFIFIIFGFTFEFLSMNFSIGYTTLTPSAVCSHIFVPRLVFGWSFVGRKTCLAYQHEVENEETNIFPANPFPPVVLTSHLEKSSRQIFKVMMALFSRLSIVASV